jgi:hypothetical protein
MELGLATHLVSSSFKRVDGDPLVVKIRARQALGKNHGV